VAGAGAVAASATVIVHGTATTAGQGATSGTARVVVWGVASATGLGVTTGVIVQRATANTTGAGSTAADPTLILLVQYGRAGAYAPARTGATQNTNPPRTSAYRPPAATADAFSAV
jgi:hypothetical protein